jgi:uncharacterized protein (TIGR02391 family)
MAKIIRRTWTTQGPTGNRVRHVAYGYTLMVNGTQERKSSSAWLTEAEALEALAARQKEIGAGLTERPAERTLAELAKEYLAYKGDQGKRSLADDKRIVETRLLPAFGATLPVRRLRASAIAQYEKARLGATVTRGTRKMSAYTVANELSVLRHMLRLARRWGYLDGVPDIVLPKRPRGRLRYLDADEIGKLLEACRASRNRVLFAVVVLALNTGMRKGEILGLEWERVDLSSARLRLDRTKSGEPRGVPINRAVYEALIALEPDTERRRGRLFPRRERSAGESDSDGVRGGAGAGRDRRLPVPRPPAHGRQPPGHARGLAEGRPGDPRPLGPPDDEPVRTPQPGAPPGGGRPAGRPNHNGERQHRGRGIDDRPSVEDPGQMPDFYEKHLPPPDVAILSVLKALRDPAAVSYRNRYNFTLMSNTQYPGVVDRAAVAMALTEAWAWLEREGLIVPRPGERGEWIEVSRRGQQLGTEADFEAYRRGNLLRRDSLDPQLEQKVWPIFILGDYDVAVVQAFKLVEVKVRQLGHYGDADYGVDMMQRAFKPGGPLADPNRQAAEQEALWSLFAGAIGVFKNPGSHRAVTFDPAAAAEAVYLANTLLRFLAEAEARLRTEP